MCKYCELNAISANETGNGCVSVKYIKDGSQIFEVSINRYISKMDKVRNNCLLISYGVEDDGVIHYLKNKEIKIKYCPFCGEKL